MENDPTKVAFDQPKPYQNERLLFRKSGQKSAPFLVNLLTWITFLILVTEAKGNSDVGSSYK